MVWLLSSTSCKVSELLTSLLKKSERVDKKSKRTPNMSPKLLQPSAAAETKTPLSFSVKKSPAPPPQGKNSCFPWGRQGTWIHWTLWVSNFSVNIFDHTFIDRKKTYSADFV